MLCHSDSPVLPASNDDPSSSHGGSGSGSGGRSHSGSEAELTDDDKEVTVVGISFGSYLVSFLFSMAVMASCCRRRYGRIRGVGA